MLSVLWKYMGTPEQLQLPLGHVSMQQFAPVMPAVAGAAQYARAHGRTHTTEGLDNARADPARGFRLARDYGRALDSHQAPSEAIHRSYNALRGEIHDQYDYMTRPKEKGGMGITHEVTSEDPYPQAGQMADDVRHGRIRTLATSTTAQAGHENETHQALSPEENDKFRAVHDVFGHAATGRGFSRHGEEAAYLSHVQMFSPAARRAATSELRAQNSYLNYHPKGGFPDTGGREVDVPNWAVPRSPSVR